MIKKLLSDIVSDPSCIDDYDPNSMPVDKARAFIRQFLSPVSEVENLSLRDTLGRVLACDILSPCNVPNHNNSAMDGYAYNIESLQIEGKTSLKIIGTAFAGKVFNENVKAGECLRIMTGAVIPTGANTVIMQERVIVEDNFITLNEIQKSGANVRYAGEDLALNQVVLVAGHLMRPADLGLIASLGIGELNVFRKLKVAFFSTGDELTQIGQPLASGQIYDSNRYTIYGMLSRLSVEIIDMGVVRDDPALLENALLAAANQADVILTTGGVSVGEADYMKDLLAKHGQVLFWKIAMKPGRPLAFGKVNNSALTSTNNNTAHYFGLPGNPVSTMVTFYQFVRSAMLILMGQANPKPLPMLNAVCTGNIKKMTGRTEFQRGLLYLAEDGLWKVKPTDNQSSGVLRSMSEANCFIVLDDTVGNVAAGTTVQVQILEGIV
ncbi:MAG: molybdopterin molybdotransferase MoeA [Methylophilaceae bacterium]|nr:molybdopterin molybdotransferase MoeA [Methylophilaceae bacterium]